MESGSAALRSPIREGRTGTERGSPYRDHLRTGRAGEAAPVGRGAFTDRRDLIVCGFHRGRRFGHANRAFPFDVIDGLRKCRGRFPPRSVPGTACGTATGVYAEKATRVE
ncbi:MAG: hypothetical protein V7633_3574 [Pseudonocardia sp.]